MGRMQADEMARLTDVDTALTWHLQSNHYPPVPLSMLGPCKAAITAYAEGNSHREIPLNGATWRGKDTAPAWAIVESHHLEAFVNSDDTED